MDNARKGKVIYGGMVRGRRNFLIINIIVTIIYLFYLINAMPYVVGKIHGPYEFNSEKFFAETKDVTLDKQIEIKKRADKSIPFYAYIGLSYQDGNRYRFNVKFDSFEKVKDGTFRDYTDPKTGEVIPKEFNAIYLGKIGDRSIPVLWNGFGIPPADADLSGIFTQPAEIVVAQISELVPDRGEITFNEYLFDARGIEMESEEIDVVCVFLGLLLVAFLFWRLARYYINPYCHPAYTQLQRYGACDTEEVIDDIESQFEGDGVYKEGKELISTDWIMTKELFMNKIAKNHRTRGRYS